jgi:hypothetical protein
MRCAHCSKERDAGAPPFLLCGTCFGAAFCHRDCLRRGHDKRACARAVAFLRGSNRGFELERCVVGDDAELPRRGAGTDAADTASAVLLDPFEQTRTVVQLPLCRHRRVEAGTGMALTDLWPEPQALADVMRWPPPDAVGEWTPDRHKLAARKADGAYTAVLVTYKLTAGHGGGVEKAPGVTIRTPEATHTFVGRVLLISGRDVYDRWVLYTFVGRRLSFVPPSPSSSSSSSLSPTIASPCCIIIRRRGNNFERLLPLTPATRALAESGCEFVSPREAQRRREAETAAKAAAAMEAAARVDLRLLVNTAAPMAREGTCFTCGAASAATKKCAGCGHARYCSRECQVAHWRAGHKDACGGHKEACGGHKEACGGHKDACGGHEEACGGHEEACGGHKEACGGRRPAH